MPARRSVANSTLLEVLAYGEGEERPFRCEAHPDTNASASVNVLKGVWYCYACGASGRVTGKEAPSAKTLLSMVDPDAAARVYPESYLDLFDWDGGNFARRFDKRTRSLLKLGCDPFTGEATFPVRNEDGQLCGVGRRQEEGEPRYRYPYDWSASRSLFMGPKDCYNADFVILVEGAADAASLIEVDQPAVGCYGAGLHLPQQEYIHRMYPRLIVLGFDADEAGRRANARTKPLVSDVCPIVSINWELWGGKDPASITQQARIAAVAHALKEGQEDG